ncbi:probable LRR receptor-like serine/threonine-protein kinase At4g20940 [Selaginella moellendorffii]|nr:probable LRR receptor-like serine/threonine-protein kinase At4g20940 [Selaginella moellendorffii]|eukprot:XP_002963516.2 probable LRR receptor-like serine/threonine-protein kinase At4g20940 [Selaginella moellendorffii]
MVVEWAMVVVMAAAALLAVQHHGCRGASVDDTQVLLSFMKGIDKDPLGSLTKSWLPESKDSNGCPSKWHGVYCDNKDGRVSRLELQGLGLSGRLLPDTLGALHSLVYLSLANNLLSGPLPADLARLSLLEQLDVSGNMLDGEMIPAMGSGLRRLQRLSLANNRLSGPIPADALTGMSALEELDLSNNALVGPIPASLAALELLRVCDLSGNQLNGSLSAQLGRLQHLERLHLAANQLTGSIPSSWMLLPAIQSLHLALNRLSGPLPWIASLLPPDLLYVNMSFNRLSGPLAPDDAANNLFANKIQILDLSANALAGSLPSFEFVFSLRVLKLRANQFTGFVPPALLSAEASLLEELDLSNNRLSGNVWTISAARLTLLNLSRNALSGGLPPRLGSCARVDLSANTFSGNLSVMRSWGNSLEWMDLSNNSLSGALPSQTAQLLRLTSLAFANNKLEGGIPAAFASFPKLTSLDLSGNTLLGPIPPTFFNSCTLVALKLSSNRLSGTIPVPTASATDAPLRLLDLASNQLDGAIPSSLLTATLQFLNLSNNKLSGDIPVDVTKLDRLQQLDLSSNQLTGSIPSTLGPPTLTLLNLSNNNLSGAIPSQLESKFPPSSFYPGNAQLLSNGFPSWNGHAPQANQPLGLVNKTRRNGRVSPSLKAGLLGGCAAALLLALAIVGLVYYNRQRQSQGDNKSGIPVFKIVERDFKVHHQQQPQQEQQQQQPQVENEKDDNVLKRLPSRKGFFSSLRPASAREEEGALGWNSPDKLAGDLFLWDGDVLFTAEELSRAPAEVLGRSSHGTSYKATLDSGHTITVKWLKEGLAKCKREFTMEARRFGGIRHDNVLPLRGYYWGPREHEKLILTDFVAYGSLADRLLTAEKSSGVGRYPPLSWPQRLRVSADIARGLCYLHDDHKLAHGNLKASNVLFEGSDLRGRLTDYGLHRLMTAAGTASQFVNAAALGYRAPELSNIKRPKPTTGADVYAYGVLLLEILTAKAADDVISGGSTAVDLPEWVKLLVSHNRSSECFDPHLHAGSLELQQLLTLALRCISAEPSARPAIRIVYQELLPMLEAAAAE